MGTEDVRATGALARMLRRRELSLDVVAGFPVDTPGSPRSLEGAGERDE
ncbi:MAG: hypothetical protein ACRDTH_19860 [Pseudonocardiaceae bacterium]